MKKVLKKLIVFCFCLFLLTGCNLKEVIKDLIGTSSSSSQQIGGGNNDGCTVYSNLSTLIEQEEVEVLSTSNLETVFEKVNEATFMATACYIVGGTRYERILV